MGFLGRILGLVRTEKDALRGIEKNSKRVYSAHRKFAKLCKGIHKKVKKKDKAIGAQFKLFMDSVESSVKPILRAEARFMRAKEGDKEALAERKRDFNKTKAEVRILRRVVENSDFGESVNKAAMKIVVSAESLLKLEKKELALMRH